MDPSVEISRKLNSVEGRGEPNHRDFYSTEIILKVCNRHCMIGEVVSLILLQASGSPGNKNAPVTNKVFLSMCWT